jgi:hypothetical protein
MTRRDYELIAFAFRDAVPTVADPKEFHYAMVIGASVVAAALKRDNPAFDYGLFMRNAGTS